MTANRLYIVARMLCTGFYLFWDKLPRRLVRRKGH